MSNTLILLFHRDLSQSKANAALSQAAASINSVTLVDMQSRYPDGTIDLHTDATKEAAMLLAADRIILQFPIQWYATPALLKAWQDAVLTRMYYIFAQTEGDKLIGTPMMVAATAGNTKQAYSREGTNYYAVDELLAPLKATAYRCGLPWHKPYITYTADKLDTTDLASACQGYISAISDFIAATNPSNGVV